MREPYELAYYAECDKNQKLEEKVFHIEEEREIVKEQLQNWHQLYQEIKPKGDNKFAQLGWCDLCANLKLNDPDICCSCEMGSKFTYDEVAFGEIDEWNNDVKE